MREAIERHADPYEIYRARRPEYETGQSVPFRVSPEPLRLSPKEAQQIGHIGRDVTGFFHAVDELYRDQADVRAVLDTGKPEIFCADRPSQYLFVRPDMILTADGFRMCELETSPFGLALAGILNQAYRSEGFETMVGDVELIDHIHATTPSEGTLWYSKKTGSYAGQIAFLADRVFSGTGRKWNAQNLATDPTHAHEGEGLYRAFYQAEYLSDPSVAALLDESLADPGRTILPSLSPHLEEKAILALLWDRRWEAHFRSQLGDASFNHLREIVPPTWIVGQEQYFAPGMPNGVENSVALATLARSKRALVIKSSGFGQNSSWAEGVHFLHKQSREKAGRILTDAANDPSQLYVIQEFHKPRDLPMTYIDGPDHVPMAARVRLTPYYAVSGKPDREGDLVAIKATGCENTDFIHASSASINTAVAA